MKLEVGETSVWDRPLSEHERGRKGRVTYSGENFRNWESHLRQHDSQSAEWGPHRGQL